MLPSAQAISAPRYVPPSTIAPDLGLPPAEPDPNPIAWLGPVEHEHHILVLGGPGPELMCALLRAGASHVTHLRAHERPEADSASLVIVPRIPSLDWLAAVLPAIRRALTARGRLVLYTGGQAVTQIQIRRMLTLLGMTAIRAHATEDGQVLSAERPARRFA